MQTTADRVEPLKKVSLIYTAGSRAGEADLIMEPESATFVYGLGTGGLTPFEHALEGKSVGDKVQYRLERRDIPAFFEHLLNSMGTLPIGEPSFYLDIEVTGVADVEQRQLVKALAAATGCGGGDCGCGCSGH
jgi:hypothetical protein